ncbi:MAG: KEOPS complex kinase/ATPase Bud32 [Nanoarchaeota archaeon]
MIIQQGAEAVISLENNQIIKERIPKSYRLKIIDEKIRKQRTKAESKILEKANKIIPTPKLIKTNEKTKEIVMEFINGKKLSENLDNFSLAKQESICRKIGENIAKIHHEGIIHGDLTTSNMIYHNNLVYFIDFGLSFHSSRTEDKAVDLHLLKQALEAKHFSQWEKLWSFIEKGYKTNKDFEKILERLKTVESRGRYKDKY